MVFINLSNHPSSLWDKTQTEDALQYGEIVDLAFPAIPVSISDKYMNHLVQEYANKIMEYDNPVVMIQGEFVFVFRMVTRLKSMGIRALACCTERISTEEKQADGSIKKVSRFVYGGMRGY